MSTLQTLSYFKFVLVYYSSGCSGQNMTPNNPVRCLLEQKCGNKIYTLTAVAEREKRRETVKFMRHCQWPLQRGDWKRRGGKVMIGAVERQQKLSEEYDRR